MANSSAFLSLVVFIVVWLLAIGPPSSSSYLTTSGKCIERERKALVNFKHALTDPSGRLSSWKGDDCCHWSGVRCNNISGHVVKLDLRNPISIPSNEDLSFMEDDEVKAYESHYGRSCLGGKLSSSLLELKYLKYLDMSVNCFDGFQIPKFLGMFEHLRYLNLSSSFFSGEIPPHLGNLSSLNHLHLGFDSRFRAVDLHTANLEWLSHLSSLKYLNLENVKVNVVDTDWWQSINMLPKLVELHLAECSLQSLPLSLPFVNLTLLSVLDLSHNWFDSSLANLLSNLTSLTKLDLSRNSFRGAIPTEFMNLKSLESLDLSQNGFNSSIPNWLFNLTSLVELDLSYNFFEGVLPDLIGILANLQHLDLSFNTLTGTIPESLGRLSKLILLYLNGNSWEGAVTEAQLMNLTRLKHLAIKTGRLQSVYYDESKVISLGFNVTYKWVPPFRLKTLELQNCLVGPRFPVWLQVQSELTFVALKNVGIEDTIHEQWFSMLSSNQATFLDLSSNKINGKLPIHLEFPRLIYLDLSNNHFEGSLPLWSTNATVLYINNNSFSGPIPSNIGQLMPRLYSFYMFENRLSGTIPSSICTMENLGSLILRTNQLSGDLPECWNESQKLIFMDIASNNLSGNIPSSLGLLSSLKVLMLSNNNLHGEIPPSLQKCNLTMFDLGRNKLSGKLPFWIGERASALQMLRLRSNSFNGEIPRQWCSLTNLHILDLASNNLSGVIPRCLGNLSALVYGKSTVESLQTMEQIVVVAKGKELKYHGRNAYFVKSIDLSGNRLVGKIPTEITKLVALGTLNFSMNNLSGCIPDDIGNLRSLETLDVSNNNLSGPIPRTLSSLTFLAHLNLSYNNLVGKIPSGYQLQTLADPSIYEGNPLLCGLPLPTKCPGDDASNVSPPFGGVLDDNGNDNENDLDMAWFYISMGPGFVVGFWVVFGTLFIKKSWRHAYFKFLENMIERIALLIALRVANLRRWAQ